MLTRTPTQLRIVLSLTVGLLININLLHAQSTPATDNPNSTPGQFVDHVYKDDKGEHKYVVFVPGNYTPEKQWPVMMFLHGGSSRGTDGRSQLFSGVAAGIRMRMSTFPFIAVFPQCEDVNSRLFGGWTDEPDDADRALKILDSVENLYSVDRNRESLLGISMGGIGAWKMAARTSHRWSALVPVAAPVDLADAAKLTGVPTWVFHAVDDPVAPIAGARDMVKAINEGGGTAHLSVLNAGAHDINSSVFPQQALYDWLLDPKQSPKLDLDFTPPAGFDTGLNQEVPFIPAAEISKAIRVRVCQDAIEALCLAGSEKSAAKPMTGAAPGIHETKRVGGVIPINVWMSGMQYQGGIEQIRVIPKSNNRLILQIGLRNITVTIPQTQVNSRLLLSVSSGPIHIMIGHNAPVWLVMELQPFVQDRQVRLNLAGVNFQIPDNSFYVPDPSGVHVRGMPLLNGRVSDSLVSNIYARKHEIEQQVISKIPAAIQDAEVKLNDELGKARVVDALATVPVWAQRFKLFPEELSIDDNGLTFVSGITLDTPGFVKKETKLRSYPAEGTMPPVANSGLEVVVAESMIRAWCELIIADNINHISANDVPTPQFQAFANRDFLQQVIPDLKRYGDNMEAAVEFTLREPVRFLNPAPETVAFHTHKPNGEVFTVSLKSLPVSVSVRKIGDKKWTPVGELDFSLEREFELYVRKPGFVKRGIALKDITPCRTTSKWTFAPGYQPVISEVDEQRIVDSILLAKDAEKAFNFERPDKPFDLVLAGIPFRPDMASFAHNHLVAQLQLPGILLTNKSKETVTYNAYVPYKGWTKQATLEAGDSQHLQVPYNTVLRRYTATEIQQFTLPIGKEIAIQGQTKFDMIAIDQDETHQKSASTLR